MNSVIIPVNNASYSSYTINADDCIEAKVTVQGKKATKGYVLHAMADFLSSVTQELRDARAHNRSTLQHLQ